jgi:hypothetical protein
MTRARPSLIFGLIAKEKPMARLRIQSILWALFSFAI